jgi:hypothetical protein
MPWGGPQAAFPLFESLARYPSLCATQIDCGRIKQAPFQSDAARAALWVDWLKMKNPAAPAVKREEDEEWGNGGWR